MKTASKWLVLIALVAIIVSVAACATPTPVTVKETVVVPQTVVAQQTVVVQQTVAVPQTVVVSAPTATPTAVSALNPDCPITPPQNPTQITYIGWSMAIVDQYTANMQKCNNVKNMKVDLRMLDNASAQEQMTLAFATGGSSPYTIIQQSNSSIQRNVWKGWLMPLDDLVTKYKAKYSLDDISKSQWDAVTFNGKIYGVPFDANTIMLMYRKDLFAKYNLKPPTTYDEVISTCNVLKQEKGLTTPFAIDLSAGWAWSIAFYEAYASMGGQYFEPGTSKPTINTPTGVKALTKIKSVVDACMGKPGLALNSTTMSAGLGNGTVGMIHTWASSGRTLIDKSKTQFWDQIAFAPAASVEPGGKLAGSAWGDYFAIPATYKGDPDLAFQIIMEAIRPDRESAAANLGIVTRTKALTKSDALPFTATAMKTINDGVGAVPRNIAYPTMDAALSNYLPLVGTGELTPEQALQKAEAEYTQKAKDLGYLK